MLPYKYQKLWDQKRPLERGDTLHRHILCLPVQWLAIKQAKTMTVELPIAKCPDFHENNTQ